MSLLSLKYVLRVMLVFAPSLSAYAVPLMIPYSGTVSVNGEVFNGNGQFKFAIVNQSCVTQQGQCETLWSNDGSSSQGSEPFNAVTITVTQGKYSIKLGDVGLGNMTTITESAFDSDATYLRIWFNDGVTGSQLLSPDRQLVSVPYAYRASVADSAMAVDSLPAGSVGASEVDSSQVQLRGNMACANANSYIHAIDENGDVTCATDDGSSYTAGSGIAIDIKNMISIANSGVTTAKLQNNAVTDAKIADMSWGKLSGIPAGFVDGVDNDTNTTYSAGSGISITGSSNQINVTSVPWGSVTGIPPGFADGVDNDTTYSAGVGLDLSDTNVISIPNGAVSNSMIASGISWYKLTSVPNGLLDGDDVAKVDYDFNNDTQSVTQNVIIGAEVNVSAASTGDKVIVNYSLSYSCKKIDPTLAAVCYLTPSKYAATTPSGYSSQMGYKEIPVQGSVGQRDGHISGLAVLTKDDVNDFVYLKIQGGDNAVFSVDDVNMVATIVPAAP